MNRSPAKRAVFNSNRRAFMAIDMLFGIIIVSSVTIGLVSIVRHEQAAEHSLADARISLHLAEHTLLNLQHGQPMPPTAGDAKLSIHPATGGNAPVGFSWVKVDATVHGHNQSLFGVVPISSLPTEKQS